MSVGTDEGFKFYKDLLGMSRDFHKGYVYDPYSEKKGKPILKRETYDSNKSIKLIEYIHSRIKRDFGDPVGYLVSACLNTERLNVFDLNTKDMVFDKYHTDRLQMLQPYRIEEKCQIIVNRFPELRGGISDKLLTFNKFDKPELVSKRNKYGIPYEVFLIIDSLTNFTKQPSFIINENKDIRNFINKINAYRKYYAISENMKDIIIDYFY